MLNQSFSLCCLHIKWQRTINKRYYILVSDICTICAFEQTKQMPANPKEEYFHQVLLKVLSYIVKQPFKGVYLLLSCADKVYFFPCTEKRPPSAVGINGRRSYSSRRTPSPDQCPSPVTLSGRCSGRCRVYWYWR